MSQQQSPFNKFTHDLRSRLNGVIGLSQILQNENLTPEQQKHISDILSCGNDILVLIDEHSEKKNEVNGTQSFVSSGNAIEVPLEQEHPETICALPTGQSVLVVDDEIESLNVLVYGLTKAGYRVFTAHNTEEAFISLKNNTPEIILLDVVMPGMSGYEFCKELRQKKEYADTPIIFLSGVTELQGRLNAYRAGGTDYVIKPFYIPEVMARVNTHMALMKSKMELRKYATQLEKLVHEKTEQLIHADRMVNLGVMSAGVAHEINNPLTFVRGNLSLLKKFEAEIIPILSEGLREHSNPKKIGFIQEELPKALNEMELGLSKISTIISGLKTFSRQETSIKSLVDVTLCIEEALTLVRSEFKNKVEVKKKFSSPLPSILANASQLSQVFVNLFINAKHAMANQNPGILRIDTENNETMIYVRIADNGTGMSKDVMQKIWHPFFTTKPKGVGTGLGLSIVHGIIKDHKGELSVDSELGKGTTFTIALPISRN